jgi:hypothetical protein
MDAVDLGTRRRHTHGHGEDGRKLLEYHHLQEAGEVTNRQAKARLPGEALPANVVVVMRRELESQRMGPKVAS